MGGRHTTTQQQQTIRMKTIKTILAAALLLCALAIHAQTPADTLPKGKKDTTKVNLGKTEVLIIEEKIEGADPTLSIEMDSTVNIINNDTIVEIKKSIRKKKPSHVWMGIDIGVNTLMNANQSFSLTGDDAPFALDYGKSIAISFNLFEKTIPIVKNNLYLSTGLGLEFNNFRFENKSVLLNPDSAPLAVSYDTTRNITKNKLTTSYLNVPLLLTFAANNKKGKNAFHISVGAMVGWKYRSHQKLVYTDYGDRQKDKEFDSFNMNPFRFTAMARIGYKHIGLFANYSLNPLFQKNKGPELYPFTMGLSFIL